MAIKKKKKSRVTMVGMEENVHLLFLFRKFSPPFAVVIVGLYICEMLSFSFCLKIRRIEIKRLI